MKSILTLVITLLIQTSTVGQNGMFDKVLRYSEAIKSIDMDEIVFNRATRVNSSNSNKPLSDFLEFADSLTIKEIKKCLNSDNAKIRALGLLSLYQTNNLKMLLSAANFLDDSAICFKASPNERFSGGFIPGESVQSEDELLARAKNLYVSDVAISLLRPYFGLSGHVYFESELELFLNERKNLDDTAGFLKLLKRKATGGISPFQEVRQPLVDALRNRIENIKNDVDRAIYKIYLSTDEYELFSQAEIVAELRFLGKERTKQILMRQPPTNDPDLRNVQNSEFSDFDYNRMCRWILLNAPAVFDQRDISFFHEQAIFEREITISWRTSMDFPYWYIAAARVDEANASEHLKSCLKLFDNEYFKFERATLYAELWHRRGLMEAEFVVDWVFGSYVLNVPGPERIDNFIYQLDQKEDLTLLKKIIADSRFESAMNVQNVIRVAWQINSLRIVHPIEELLIQKIWHPFGLDRVEWWRDRALKEYPNETKEMLEETKALIAELRKIE